MTIIVNGECYANFDTDRNSRVWKDAIQYNFFSAGGGTKYRRAMERLSPGERIWVKISPAKYVGVGLVIGSAQPASDFKVTTSDGHQISIFDVPKRGTYRRKDIDNPELCEYFVPMNWLQTVPEEKGFWGKDFFFMRGNLTYSGQSDRWLKTLDRLKQRFPAFDKPAL